LGKKKNSPKSTKICRTPLQNVGLDRKNSTKNTRERKVRTVGVLKKDTPCSKFKRGLGLSGLKEGDKAVL